MLLFALLLVCAALAVGAKLHAAPKVQSVYPVHHIPADIILDDRMDINTASAQDLESLPGIGSVLAERIIAYREANGAFDDIEDILLVDGVGERLLDDIGDMIFAGKQ